MKIQNKLLIANMFITLVGMAVLSIATLFIITDYITERVGEDIVEKNRTATRSVMQQEYLEEMDGPKPKIRVVPYTNLMIDLEDGTIRDNVIGRIGERDKEAFLRMSINQIEAIKIEKGTVMAYATERRGKEGNYLVVTYAYNDDIQHVVNQILGVLFSVSLLVGVGIIYVNMLFAKYITKPIGQLVDVTEKIGNQVFDEKVVIDTQDEFDHLAQAINKMGDKLKVHDEEQRKLYENFSHELKTPLTVISGYAEGIKTGVFNEMAEPLDEIVKSCQMMRKQIDQMIYLSKLDSINEQIHRQRIELNTLIAGVLDELDSLIIIKEIDIFFEPIEEIILDGDVEKIKRMLINCLSNCIKYTEDYIGIEVTQKEGWVEIQIDDNGEGFSQEILENPYTRNIIGTKEGTGLGLSIVKKVIDQHKGTVDFYNKIEGGACYLIKLP